MRRLDDVSLGDILPPSLSADSGVMAAAGAIDEELSEAGALIREALIVSRIDELPEVLLDLLAWQWHVDFYPPGIPAATKRNLVTSSIPWHRKKGTLWAVKRLCEDVFGRAEVSEWFEYGGDPFRFRVATEGRLTGEESWRLFFQSLDLAKNVRSHLDEVTILRPLTIGIRHSGPLCTRGAVSIAPAPPAGASIVARRGIGHSRRGFMTLFTKGG